MNMQTNKEKLLADRCGRKNPFRTPEGYFEQLPQNIMQQIHQRRKKQIFFRWTAVAAMIACFSAITLTLMPTETTVPQQVVAEENQYYYEDELDYSMLSNMDIALYITEAE